MGLKHGEVNPLAVANLRQVDFCPAHFEPVMFDLVVDQKIITDWLYENTDGRFYIGQAVKQGEGDEKARLCFCVAFEVHSEASYFAMFLTTINSHESLYL